MTGTAHTVGHTPGPWCINPNHPTIISTEDNDADIAEVDGWPLNLAAEDQANRHLIAAAPCLLGRLIAERDNRDHILKLLVLGQVDLVIEKLRNGSTATDEAIHRARTGEVS